MCGITGWIDWERDLRDERPVLERMTRCLLHRGPDDERLWLSPRAALGHRRLTVVDPEGGGQPMTRRVGGRIYTMTYNGELYNTQELRAELERLGHRLTTRSDTEALLLAYAQWGPGALERLNGIFALAIWTEPDEHLFLARDRLGVKPLFWAPRGRGLLFASELKALLVHPLIRPEVDEEGLCEVLFLGPSRTPGHGIYRNVHELRPGHFLQMDDRGLRQQRYWQLQSHTHEESLPATVEHVRDLLIDAVRRQLVSDVPVGTLLSGGIDSSAITAVAAGAFREWGREPLHTWSVDYQENEQYFRSSAFQPEADAPWARRVSAFTQTTHHEVLLGTPELEGSLQPATEARDLPGMADVDGSLLLFCRAIRRELTVVLSGECADEIFGGYPWFHQAEALQADSFPWIRMLPERSALLVPDLRQRLRPVDYVRERYRQSLAEVPRLPGEAAEEARRRELFYLNLAWFMATLLDRKDRMSMAAGLEARVPFCDHRLVEYVWNVPWAMKSCDHREKGLLRRALRGLLPDLVLERRKSPYPKTHHPAYAAAVRRRVLAILAEPGARLTEVMDAAAVRRLAEGEHPAAGLPWFGQLMSTPQMLAWLCQVEHWLRRYHVNLV